MKRIIFMTILVLAFWSSVFGQHEEQKEPIPIRDPIRFGKMTWKDEKRFLTDIFTPIIANNEKICFLILQFDKKTHNSIVNKRIKRIENFLTNSLKIEKSQFKIAVSKGNREETEYWILNKSDIPKN
jgi:hypothetical protein